MCARTNKTGVVVSLCFFPSLRQYRLGVHFLQTMLPLLPPTSNNTHIYIHKIPSEKKKSTKIKTKKINTKLLFSFDKNAYSIYINSPYFTKTMGPVEAATGILLKSTPQYPTLPPPVPTKGDSLLWKMRFVYIDKLKVLGSSHLNDFLGVEYLFKMPNWTNEQIYGIF